MKTLALSLLLIVGSSIIQGRAADAGLSLSISIPSSEKGEHVLDQAQTPHFHVILANTSDKPKRIWAPWSEAGYRLLGFEITDAAGKKGNAKKKELQSVSHKLPEVCVVQPHESIVFDVQYSDTGTWENFPKAVRGFLPVSIRAVFEIQSSPASSSSNVWSGKVVSDPIEVVIYPWEPDKSK